MSLALLLFSADIDAMRAFYSDVLQARIEKAAEGAIAVHLHGAELMFTALDLWQTAPAMTGTIYIRVADVDALWTRVRDRAPVAWPLQDMDYGTREFALEDPDGYTLAFMQGDPAA